MCPAPPRWLWAVTCCFAVTALAFLVLSSALYLSVRYTWQEPGHARAKDVSEILGSREYTPAQKGILLRPYILRGMRRKELVSLLGEPEESWLSYRQWGLGVVLHDGRVVRVLTRGDPLDTRQQS